jgi:uncharacterized protein (DUF1330 family)
MSVYSIVEITVTDPAWLEEYGPNVTKMVEAHGGRYLARTGEVEAVEGSIESGSLVVLLEWPSNEAAMEFYNSEDYRPYLEARVAGSNGKFLMVSGNDDLDLRTK